MKIIRLKTGTDVVYLDNDDIESACRQFICSSQPLYAKGFVGLPAHFTIPMDLHIEFEMVPGKGPVDVGVVAQARDGSAVA